MPMRTASVFASLFGACRAANVYVMLPLTAITNDGKVNDPSGLSGKLDKLKQANVDGFMVDVWWGVTERQPKTYDFDAYQQLVGMAEEKGMKVQFVASFHQCGGNVGDECDIPLPSWVTQNNGIWYKDQQGHETKEYISLFADGVQLQDGRTPVDSYTDWMQALSSAFAGKLGSVVATIQVGLGPCGELRYPSYPLKYWSFPGIGEFQVYDEHALASLAAAGAAKKWTGPPSDAGTYDNKPWETGFFGGGYKSDYGSFFMGWYFDNLKAHGDRVLAKASQIFGGKVQLAAKVSGVHWWYGDETHAAEVTAGYFNCEGRNAYQEIAQVFASHKTNVDFTCLEMRNSEQDPSSKSLPENLVAQVQQAAVAAGTGFSGENALPRYDDSAYEEILKYKSQLHAFTYLRLDDKLLNDGFNSFRNFAQQMKSMSETAVVV